MRKSIICLIALLVLLPLLGAEPTFLTPYLSAFSQITGWSTNPGSLGFELSGASLQVVGEPVLVAPNEGYGRSMTVSFASQFHLDDPSAWLFSQHPEAKLTGAVFAIGSGWAGYATIGGRMGLLVKHKHSVPEGGSTLVLLGVALLGLYSLGWIRRFAFGCVSAVRGNFHRLRFRPAAHEATDDPKLKGIAARDEQKNQPEFG